MLIRFSVANIFSFGEEKEFNMLPAPQIGRLSEHTYNKNGFELLKLASIYGANAAGKSNLIKALAMLQEIVTEEKLLARDTRFKFRERLETPQILGTEFFQKEKAYYYALKITGNKISEEELYESGLGAKQDCLIFERKTNEENRTSIHFFDEFAKEKENVVLKTVIEKNLSKSDKPILKLLTTLNNPYLDSVKNAFEWFENTLQIITPDSKPRALTQRIDIDPEFHKYAEDTLRAFHVGINNLKVEKKTIKEFFGENNEKELNELIYKVESSPNKIISFRNKNDEFIISKEKEEFYIKQLKLEHLGKNEKNFFFDLDEESDGTLRLLDFIPAFKDIFCNDKVYIIDEIERSIHPVLIKEMVRKFSADKETKGQLIFTTHESNLLDQDIFRQDEIWFAEKDKAGNTDLYALSSFKEHTIADLRKGYLTGRYGAIPFLGNLRDLNWHEYDIRK
ncbi:hypothetical protein EZS27_024251 [termite gut metagenome]|uniref:ATPase AAA-type core domain-containing protein n=1 Tax=termite gut metagenome TaxID=433724 RepID=A0A5J4QZE6_9ZZZZ